MLLAQQQATATRSGKNKLHGEAAGVLPPLFHQGCTDVLLPGVVQQLLSSRLESPSEGRQYHPEDHRLLTALFGGLMQLLQDQQRCQYTHKDPSLPWTSSV